MNFQLKNKSKINTFKNMIELLKKSTGVAKLVFKKTHLYIQGMDRGHICLYDIKLFSAWFDNYSLENDEELVLSIDINILQLILSIHQEKQNMTILFDNNESEYLIIKFENSEENEKYVDINKSFQIPLIDLDTEFLSIPESDYSVIFTINSKIINDVVNQLLIFGDNLSLSSTDSTIIMTSSSEKGKMESIINFDDLIDYELEENTILNLSFSLNILCKMISSRISPQIKVSFTNDMPIKIKYEFGEESYMEFYCAPKINDD